MKFCSPSRLLAALLAAALLTGCSNPLIPPTEEPPAATVSGSVSIGLAAPLSGAYLFTTAWGDCEGDADIRELIFGGDTVVPTGEGTFASNPVVVSSVTQTEEPNGDRTYLFTLNKPSTFGPPSQDRPTCRPGYPKHRSSAPGPEVSAHGNLCP